MTALLDVDLNEYFLRTPIVELTTTVKGLKEKHENATSSAPFASETSDHAVRQSEKELLEIVGRICKTKGIVSDECIKIRQTILQAVSAADKPSMPTTTPPQPTNAVHDWNLSFQTCLDHGDMLTATLIQERLNADIDLRKRLLNQEKCLAAVLTRPSWDILPINVLFNCYQSLLLMLPSLSPSSALEYILTQRIQVMDRLLREVEQKDPMTLTQNQAIKLSLALSMVSHIEGLINFPHKVDVRMTQLLTRSSSFITIKRHECRCRPRDDRLVPEAAHPTLYHIDEISAKDVALIFDEGSPSVCDLKCISSIAISQALQQNLQELRQRFRESIQSLLPAHTFDIVNYYDSIHSFYTLVLLLLIEWSDDTLLGQPWKPFTTSLPCLQHALRHCPSVTKLRGVLQSIQDKELLAGISHPSDILEIEETINLLRMQYLTSMTAFVEAQTRAELESDSMKCGRSDRIAHQIFLNLWRSMENRMKRKGTDIVDLIRISDYELKDKLVSSLTAQLLQLQTDNLDMYHFHYIWILMRYQDKTTDTLRQALLDEFLDDFWTEDLRISRNNLTELQAEAASVANRLFSHIKCSLNTSSGSSRVWKEEDVLWIVELLIKEVLPVLTRPWRLPLRGKDLKHPEEWYDIIRLSFLKRIAVLMRDDVPNASSIAFIRALYSIILREEPQIVEASNLLFTLSLELGQILNEVASAVTSEVRLRAESLASAIATLIQPFISRDLQIGMRPLDECTVAPLPAQDAQQPKFFKKLPIVRRVPLKQPSIVDTTPSLGLPQGSNEEGAFSLSQLLTVRPAFTSAFGALWDNVISK